MKVVVVFKGQEFEEGIFGVYSSLEKAREALAFTAYNPFAIKRGTPNDFFYEEAEIDTPLDESSDRRPLFP